MSKLNHKLIDETKLGVKEVLKHMDKLSDEFVDFLVRSQPDRFKLVEGADDKSVISPFGIIPMLSKQLEHKFQQFLKEMTPEMKEEVKRQAAILEFEKKPKFDN